MFMRLENIAGPEVFIPKIGWVSYFFSKKINVKNSRAHFLSVRDYERRINNLYVYTYLSTDRCQMREFRLILMFIVLCLYTPIHELGHLIAAHIAGAHILRIGFSSVSVDHLSFTDLSRIVLFKEAGFVATFYPALLIFFFL